MAFLSGAVLTAAELNTFQPGTKITLPDGSVGAPALAFTDDPNTGMYSASANTINFATAGALRATINASGITANLVGNVTGNASTASKWAAATTLTLGGDATGSVVFDGSDTTETLNVVVVNDSHTHDTRYLLNTTDTLSGALTVTGNVTAQGDLYVGKNGGNDSNIYFYDDNSNAWRLFMWDDSLNRFYFQGSIAPAGAVYVQNGTAGVPTYSFASDPNTGLYRFGSDVVAMSGGGRWGLAATSTASSINLANTTQLGVFSTVIYDASSQRSHKQNIAAKSGQDSLDRILTLEPVSFNYIKERVPLRESAGELGEFEIFEGLIAEDVYPEAQLLGWERRGGHDDANHLGVEELIAEGYALDEVVPTNVRWNVITTDLVGATKVMADQIERLMARVDALETAA